MKNIIVYYLFIFIPLLFIVWGAKDYFFTGSQFFLILAGYIFVYHPAISGVRLIGIHKINRSKFWMNFVPFWNWKYFNALFFNLD